MNKLTRKKSSFHVKPCAGISGLGAFSLTTLSAAPVKIRLGTLAPNGSSYYKHLQVMGENWRKAPGGGATLTIYPDGTMGSEADMVRRMKLGQLQAAMVTTSGLSEIEPGATGLQSMPMVFRTLGEVDYIGEKLQPMLEKRLAEKGFIVLFWSDTGWVRFFPSNRSSRRMISRRPNCLSRPIVPPKKIFIARPVAIPCRWKSPIFCLICKPG